MSKANTFDFDNQPSLFGHPIGLFVLFFTEMWERFSYYGMRAILVLYIISSATGDNPGLGWESSEALALYGWYTMLVYVMSIPGGILADKFIGQKKAVLYGGLTLVAGHGILAIEAIWAFYTGLALIILGVGGLKPNISTMVGGLYKQGDERRDQGFTIFYIGINVGAFLSSLIVGAVGETIGWHYGFGLAGIGMLLGQVIFMLGQKYLKGVGEPPSKAPKAAGEAADSSFGDLFQELFRSPVQLAITAGLIVGSSILAFTAFEGTDRYLYTALFLFLSIGAGLMMMIYKEVNSIEKDRFMVLILSFLIIIVFWGAFEQAGGLLNIYTLNKIDRTVNFLTIDLLFYGAGGILVILGIIHYLQKKDTYYLFLPIGALILAGYSFYRSDLYTSEMYEIPASVFQSVNALFIIIFGTLVGSFWIWWKHQGYESSSLVKMAVGTIIMGAGFLFMAKASADVEQYGDKAALYLLILAYLLHTLGELCASPVALSFITKVAPVKYVSIMMGVYFAATGLGNKVAGAIGESSQLETVSTELVASPAEYDLVADTVIMKADDFEFTANAYLEGGQVVIREGGVDVKELLQLSSENEQLLTEYLQEEGAASDAQLTAVVRMAYDEEAKAAMKDGGAKVDISKYSGEIELFELQNQQEYKTFVGIFIFTAAFGVLLLLFFKRLKKLTHGAEDTTDTHFEEQEGYEIADQTDEDNPTQDDDGSMLNPPKS
jgi:POT family proton-dependent oligopeptide transporter